MIDFQMFISNYSQDLKLPSNDIQELNTTLKFQKEFMTYAENKKGAILTSYLLDHFEGYEILGDSLYGLNVFSGAIDEFKDSNLNNISILNISLEIGNNNEIIINSKVNIEISATVTSRVTHSVYQTGFVNISGKLEISASFLMPTKANITVQEYFSEKNNIGLADMSNLENISIEEGEHRFDFDYYENHCKN